MLTQDDTYGDYFFPKGTMFFANAWSIHRTAEFKSPDDFVPERFMHNKFGVKADKDIGDDKRRVSYGFGAGRRVCSGQRLAENSLVRES
jgi:cytochrome P450